MKTIELSQGRSALVDDEDYDNLSQYGWYAVYQGGKWYAKGWVNGIEILMHRFILAAGHHQQVDHVSGDGLDNRRANIRFSSQRMNNANKGKKKTETQTSKYKGVYWDSSYGRWRVKCDSKHVGRFDDEIEAAQAYDEKARIAFGEFAVLNFPGPIAQ